ncbi:MoxR family ATPase [Micrococcaceae bacterium Sec7.4]
MKFNQTLTDVIAIDLDESIVPALMGEPGVGKSSFVEDLARSMNTRAFVLPCNQLADKADLTGARLVPTADGKSYSQVFYPHHVVQEAIEYALANPRENPILFLDEINRTTPDVTSAALTLVTLRRLGSVALPDNLRLMIAGNDKGNVTTLDEASLSRFALYHVEPDAGTLLALLGNEINPWVAKVLTQHPNLVFEKSAPNGFVADGNDDDDDSATATMSDLFDSGEEMLQLTTPRTIHAVSRWLNKVPQSTLQEYIATPVSIEGRDTTLLNEVLEGKVGNTGFTTHLVANIAETLASGVSGQAAAHTAPKPQVYDQLKSAQTASDLADLLNGLNDREKSGSLLYALYEKADNSRLIGELAAVTTKLETEHTKDLMKLAGNSQLDEGNVEAFLATGEPIAESMRVIFGIF